MNEGLLRREVGKAGAGAGEECQTEGVSLDRFSRNKTVIGQNLKRSRLDSSTFP